MADFGPGWQQFMRAANLIGPPQQDSAMGTAPPVQAPGMPAPNRLPSSGVSQSDAYGYPGYGKVDEYITTDVDRSNPFDTQNSVLDAFRQSVLNPPQREHMTYPDKTLAGFHKGLEVAATPTDYEKNRVYVGGHPYQQVKAYTDPETGEQKFINKYKQPGFMEQVMKAMPASVEPVADILNQDYKDKVADWELKNKGLTAAANAEAQMALGNYREAQAGAVPQNAKARMMQAEAALSRASTAERLALLKDLSESERIELLQRGKISLAELNNAAAMSRTVTTQEGAMARTVERGRQSLVLQAARQKGIMQQIDLKHLGDAELEELRQDNRIELQGARSQAEKDQIILREVERRKTRAIPAAGSAGAYETQKRTGLQGKVAGVLNQHPEWQGLVNFDSNGFPVIETNDEDTYDQIYQAIYGVPLYEKPPAPAAPPPPAGYGASPAPTGLPPSPPPVGSAPMTGAGNAPNASPIGGQPAAQAPAQPQAVQPRGAAPGTVEMLTPDGKGTRSVPTNQVELAKKQGYKPIGGQ